MPRPPLNLMLDQVRRWAGLKDVQALSDGQLLDRFLTLRDEAAFTALVRRFAPLVWDTCSGLLRGEADAEDAFQATFLVLVRRAPSLDRQRPLGPWLAEVARRTAHKALQRNRPLNKYQHTVEPTVPSTAEEAALREMRRLVHEEVYKLPERDRLPVVLCWLQGWTHEKAARELGLPRGSMAKRLAVAQDRLRRRLLARGVTLALTGLAVGVAEPCSRSLQAATVQAGLQWAVHDTAAGVISASTLSLAEGVLRAMTVAKVRAAVLVALVAGFLGVGSVSVWNLARGERAPDDAEPVAQAPDTPPEFDSNTPEPNDQDTVGAVPVALDPSLLRALRLRAKLASPVDFKGIPPDPKMTFSEALEFVADRYDLVFDVDEKAFQKVDGKDVDILTQAIADREIPKMRNVRLDTVLKRIMDRLKSPATYRIHEDRIVVVPMKYQDLRELFDDAEAEPRVNLELMPQPLEQALEKLATQTGVNIVIDSRVSEKADQGKVKASLKNVPLDSAVRMLADMADLKPVVLEGAIYITSKPNATVLQQEEDKRRKEKLERAKAQTPPESKEEPKKPSN